MKSVCIIKKSFFSYTSTGTTSFSTMGWTLPLLVILAGVALAEKIVLPRDEYSRYIEYPDEEGNIHVIDLEAEPDWDSLDEILRKPENNLYLLYTRRNRSKPEVLEIHNDASVRASNFDANLHTVVIAHGWLNNKDSEVNTVITKAYLDKSDVNVIVIDWNRLARLDYVTAVIGVPKVGRGLGQFLYFLHLNFGARLENMHLIGFSLGAHLVGNAGRQLNGRVGRITGLDPAGPLWHFNSDSLRQSNGIYVEGIHTNGGIAGMGIGSDCGHADFYVNGGNTQPGCLTPICNHDRACTLFASSVTNDHLVGNKCSNSLQVTLNNCKGAQFNMGNGEVEKYGTGSYRVNTGRKYPY